MAVSISAYNHTASLIFAQTITLTNLKAMLLSASASFTAANTTVDPVAGAASPHRAKEVYGNGWAEGGQALTSVAASIVTTNDAKLDADDISVTASGGDIGPASAALIYDATSMKPLFYIDFGTAKTSNSGIPFVITLDAAGLATLTY